MRILLRELLRILPKELLRTLPKELLRILQTFRLSVSQVAAPNLLERMAPVTCIQSVGARCLLHPVRLVAKGREGWCVYLAPACDCQS